MFSQKKGKADIYNEPEFLVRYVGKAETFVATKKGCTHSVVQRIWDNSEEEHLMRRITVFISASGIVITNYENKKIEETIDIKDIAYCCAERVPHERVFTWICKNNVAKKLECYAVVCSTQEKAQLMAVLLNKAFQVAYVDWKGKKDKQARLKYAARKKQKDAGSNINLSDDGDRASTSSGSDMSMPVNGTPNGHGSVGSDEDFEYMESMMSQMNIVEENEISFSDNSFIVADVNKAGQSPTVETRT